MTAKRLNPKDEVQRVALAKASSFTRGEAVLYRMGNIVHISMHFYNSSNVSTGTALFETIPSELRPPYGYGIPAMMTVESGSVNAYYVTVNANGTITQSLSSTTRAIFASGTYMLA